MTGALHTLDQNLSLWINSIHSPFSDGLWQLFSDKTFWFPMYALVLYFLIRRLGWKKALACTLALVLTIVFCDQSAYLLKNAVGRLRPCYSLRMLQGGLHVLEGRGSFFGFYSGHAANALFRLRVVWPETVQMDVDEPREDPVVVRPIVAKAFDGGDDAVAVPFKTAVEHRLCRDQVAC